MFQQILTAEMDRMVRSLSFVRVADWLNSYIGRQHPDKEAPIWINHMVSRQG
jgi:hypothetical protein